MERIRLACVGACLAWFTAAAPAQTPAWGTAPPGCPCYQPPGTGPWNPAPTTPTTPSTTTPSTTTPATPPTAPGAEPSTLPGEAFAQGSEAGTQAAPSVAPAMFGDLIGIQGGRYIIVGPNTATPFAVVQHPGRIIAPEPLHSSYKVMEGESPRPENRAYVTYTFYDNVDRLFPGIGQSNLHRETLGLEQTFGGGDSSVGLRLPFLQLTGPADVEDNFVGDLSLIYKHAFINDPQTGNLLSGGLVLTVPTGQGLQIAGESTLRSTVFQPFVGFFYNLDDFYVEEFSSVAVPTDMRDVTLLFNSVALGYHLYRDDCDDAPVRGVMPQLELHVNTPLSHRGLTSTPVNFSDSVDLTGGVRVLLRRVELGACVGTPLSGPKPYDVEAMANLTYHW